MHELNLDNMIHRKFYVQIIVLLNVQKHYVYFGPVIGSQSDIESELWRA